MGYCIPYSTVATVYYCTTTYMYGIQQYLKFLKLHRYITCCGRKEGRRSCIGGHRLRLCREMTLQATSAQTAVSTVFITPPNPPHTTTRITHRTTTCTTTRRTTARIPPVVVVLRVQRIVPPVAPAQHARPVGRDESGHPRGPGHGFDGLLLAD